jgi:putative pyruvate formate lyase activating enzyme
VLCYYPFMEKSWTELFKQCFLCPRECGVDRLAEGEKSRAGFCRQDGRLRVAYVGPHFGEEPPLTGTRGSGTVFFTGCSLRCSYCQNVQISSGGLGEAVEMQGLLAKVEGMILREHVHNINFVTPDHFFPYVFELVTLLRSKGYDLPIVFNLSGYQSVNCLKWAREVVDIYLPDFKYADRDLAKKLSKCRDYPDVALAALSEMLSQKGFLDSFGTGDSLAKKGVLVRHLILPGYVENSIDALTTLFVEFGAELPLSLMSQYVPVTPQEAEALNRYLTEEEFHRVYSHALDLGFEHLFVQFPEDPATRCKPPFLPDFRLDKPFSTPPEQD